MLESCQATAIFQTVPCTDLDIHKSTLVSVLTENDWQMYTRSRAQRRGVTSNRQCTHRDIGGVGVRSQVFEPV